MSSHRFIIHLNPVLAQKVSRDIMLSMHMLDKYTYIVSVITHT